MAKVVESSVDFDKMARAIPVAVREDMLVSAKLIIQDITERINRGVTASGAAQRQNTPKVQSDKERRLGHHKPLVESGKLGRFSAWRINGVSPNVARAPRGNRLRIDHPLQTETTFGRRKYAGKHYADILPHLERKGYRVPIGISREVLPQLRRVAPAMWKAVITQGKVMGPVSRPQIQRFIEAQFAGTLRAA